MVAAVIQKALYKIFMSGQVYISVSAHKFSFAYIEMTKDLGMANIYISSIEQSDAKKALKELRENSQRVRFLLSKEVKLRMIPEIRFYVDEKIRNQDELMDKINHLSYGN